MSKLIDEFKEFIAKGNVMDMAVGVIVGGAFSSIVNSLIEDIINPLISLLGGGDGVEVKGLTFMGLDFGSFIGAIINFLIVALIVFALVKAVNKIKDVAGLAEAEEEEPAPAPTCPFCLEEIKEGAKRCPHCGAEL